MITLPDNVLFASPLCEIPRLDCNDFVQIMETRSQEFGIIPTQSEVSSWKANYEALKVLFCKCKLPDDAYVAFEYKVPVGGGRIDCMLFGRGKDTQSNVIHLELKQWSNENVVAYYDHHTFKADVLVDGYSSGSKYTAHPCEQVSGYDNILSNHVKALEENDIKLYGFAYCYNYDSNAEKLDLLDGYYRPVMDKYPLYCKDQRDAFASRLHDLLCNGNGPSIFESFATSEIGMTKRLHDVAARMLEGAEDVFSLIGDQIDVYNNILGAVKSTSPDEKTVIIVKGGPGTGKSVLAMRLLSELYKDEYNCNNVYYATRSSSLRNQWVEILRSVARRFGDGDASSLIQSTYDFKPYRYNNKENGGDVLIVDEAHRIAYKSNDQTDSHREDADRSYLPQLLSMLYTSRVCVFFIDDKQAIVPTEIGLSSNIKKAADNYRSYILKANRIFKGEEFCPVDDEVLKDIPSLANLIKERDKLKKKLEALDADSNKYNNCFKRIKGLDRMIGLPIIETKIKNVKVKVFELKDQFRCNGSNNYLDWIDHVLYESGELKKPKLNTSSYEFKVFDNPSDLYDKIRSLDDYAVVADQFEVEMGELFSYKALSEHTKDMEFMTSARIVAGWCWDWNTKANPQVNGENGDLNKEVDLTEFGFDFSLPWETQASPRNDYRYKYAKDADSWCNQKEGVNQVGCIHSIQGWETDYIGVIIGPDLIWDESACCLCYNPKGRNHNLSAKASNENDQLILNTYRVLLTRGKKGCFIFACDPKVREYFKRCMQE